MSVISHFVELISFFIIIAAWFQNKPKNECFRPVVFVFLSSHHLAISLHSNRKVCLDTTTDLFDTRIVVHMQSPDGLPNQSLWDLITEHVPESELQKIHTALGPSLVDLYRDVHTEVEMWHKMWRQSQQSDFGSRAGTPHPHQQGSPLADPPAVKELLRAEVKMLLQTLRERVSGAGRDREELLFRYKPEMVDYALGHPDSCHRVSIDPGGADNGGRPSSQCSVRSCAEDEIDSVREKLNASDIDQVVDQLRSVLMKDCEELKRLVKYFKGNIKQKCQSQLLKPEPSLSELRELRGALQMDLELYPPTLAASRSSSLPLKEPRNRLRLSAGQRFPEETLHGSSTTPAPRPHPLPPLCQTKPRPPLSAPPNKTSASVKLINSPSASRIQGQLRSTFAASGSRKTQTPICNRITASGHPDSPSSTALPGPGRGQIKDETLRGCRASPEQDSSGLQHRSCASSPGFKKESSRNSPINTTHQTAHHSTPSPNRKCDLSPQAERRRGTVRRFGHTYRYPSSARSDSGPDSNNSSDPSVTIQRNSETQTGKQSPSFGGSVASSTVEKDARVCFTEKDSVLSEIRVSPPQTGPKTNSRMNRDGVLRKDFVHPGSKQFYVPSDGPPESTTSQRKNVQEAKTELEFIGKLLQPVPPPRVST